MRLDPKSRSSGRGCAKIVTVSGFFVPRRGPEPGTPLANSALLERFGLRLPLHRRHVQRQIKNAAVLGLGLLLGSLGVYNLILKSTWSLLDDGVFWRSGPEGICAARLDPGGPAALAGVRVGDVLLAVDGAEVVSADDIQERLTLREPGAKLQYSVLRADERRSIVLVVRPLTQGNVRLFYYLSLVGFFSLVVGTIVMLRRPPDRASVHFYAICLLFFLMYSTSYTGKLNFADWTLFWTDHLAVLFLPVVFLHFCLSFPERRLAATRAWLVPASYLPALALAGAAVLSQILFVTISGGEVLWRISAVIDRWKPLYFAALFAASFLILVDSYRRTRNLTARKQMKWLVWGTGAGVLPFFGFYAVPFALGRDPQLAMELAGYIPLALIPLAVAYAVVQHRLMDVELIFRRTLGYVLAIAAIVGVGLLAAGLLDVVLTGQRDPHGTIIAILTSLVVLLLFTPIKSRVQEGIDRLVYKERYDSRKALVRLSQDLNADLDLMRLTDRLREGVVRALGVQATAIYLPDDDGHFRVFRAAGCTTDLPPLPSNGHLVSRLAAGALVDLGRDGAAYNEIGASDLAYFFPCRVEGRLIAVAGIGLKENLEPLNSEEVDLLQAIAGQVATAFLNGRLYHRLQEKAVELTRLTEYNESILESLVAGILVLDLDGRIVRWNRAMETLTGRWREEALGHLLDDVFPAAFLAALRANLVMEERQVSTHIDRLHLETADGRELTVNVTLTPFEVGAGKRWGTILILDDVTSRVQLQEQLQHSEKMASIGLLAAGVAHEVNTPLAGISSYTQMLREQVSPEDPRAPLLEKIEKQTFRAAKIITNLLNFARSGSGDAAILDVNQVLQDVLSLVEHQLAHAHIKVRRELAMDLPRIHGNENRLQQVFFNLVLNARDAMPSGGWLTITTRCRGSELLIQVSDTGEGIRREDLKRIYDPFFTTKGLGRGTGLGLSVSYGIVREHGGSISVDSAPGKGTTFEVSLPAPALSQSHAVTS
jgi:two-component system, NtrC family, sensor kinase